MKISFQFNNQNYSLEIQRGEDALAAIDNFLKNNRIEFNALDGIKIDDSLTFAGDSPVAAFSRNGRGKNGSVSWRIAETIIKVLNFVAI